MSDLARSVARGYGRDRATADRTLQRLTDRLRQVPVALAEHDPQVRVLVIIGGNTLSAGVPGIKYAAGPIVPLAAYDPEIDTVFPDGMGRANLYVNAVLQSLRVLVRHNYGAYKAPIIGGSQVTVFGTESLVFAAVTMSLYTFGWGEQG